MLLKAAKSSLDLDRVNQTPLFEIVELLPAVVSSVEADYPRGELLPPPDLVTTLGVLLI